MILKAGARNEPVIHAHPVHKGPIDLVHLAKQTLGDKGLEDEVLRMFDQLARVYFSRLENSTNVSDLLTNVRSLKAAAAGVGAWALYDLAKAMETGLAAGEPLNPEHVDDIHIAVQEVSAYITDRLDDDGLTA